MTKDQILAAMAAEPDKAKRIHVKGREPIEVDDCMGARFHPCDSTELVCIPLNGTLAFVDLEEVQSVEHFARPGPLQRVELELMTWMIESLDERAKRLGVGRDQLVRVWLEEKLRDPVS